MRYISELIHEERIIQRSRGSVFLKGGASPCGGEEYGTAGDARYRDCKVNLLALGDVGGTVLLGLKLLGGVPYHGDDKALAENDTSDTQKNDYPLIDTIGIYDLNEKLLRRYEREINQIYFPDGRKLPQVKILDECELFDCDMFIFCASKGVPPVGAAGDVRMAQLEANSKLMEIYAKMAVKEGFEGIFAVVSDPVDPLCKAAVLAGLRAEQVQGYGLGVMNARAAYFAAHIGLQKSHNDKNIWLNENEPKNASLRHAFAVYKDEGRAFGPHGEDLVIANSIKNYDDEISRKLTELTVNSNMDTRADGFKPYIAPAISSGAISLIETLKSDWNYSSVYFGNGIDGAFLGCRNRRRGGLIEVEDLPLDDRLYARIEQAYSNLKKL